LNTNILIEQNFAGTFEGAISQFRMYVSPLSAPEVKHNFGLLKNQFMMFNPDCPDCSTIVCAPDDFTYEIAGLTPTPSPTITPTMTPTPTPTPTLAPEPPKIYWGKFSGTSITSGDTSLLSSGYTSNPTGNYKSFSSSTNPEFIYFLIPTGITQPTEFRDSTGGCFGFNIPFNNIGTIFIIDANGFSITYFVYKSTITTAGPANVWLCP
jgi:hypothetical protein